MNYKVGDKVIVKGDLVSGKDYKNVYFNDNMEKFIGKELTIGYVNEREKMYSVKENGWNWSDAMLEAPKVKNQAPTKIRILFNENATIAKANGKQGIALCNPTDEYDVLEGIRVAVGRLLDIDVKEIVAPKVKSIDEYSVKELLDEIAKRVK